MAEITLNDGSRLRTFPRPPAGFDPLTASRAELECYGFPPRRGDRHSQERYRRVWGRIKDKFRYVEPTFAIDGRRPPRPREPTYSNANWSGGIVLAPTGQSFCGVAAQWIVPNIYPPNETDEFWIGSWIGLDGYTGEGANELLQAGVGQDVYWIGGALHHDINVWWEWIPGNSVPITGVPISPGDLVMVAIYTSGKGSTAATVAVTNVTNGSSTSVPAVAPSGTTLVGNSAEWIVEEPLAFPGGNTLPDYGEVYFSDCAAYIARGGEVVPDPSNGTTVDIGSGTDDSVISQGNLIAPGIVQCSYTGQSPAP
jgi:Peptidase A4 family